VHLQASAEVDKVVAVDIAVVDAVALVDPLVMEMAADDSLVMAVEVEPWATVSVDVAVEFPPTDWADEVQAMVMGASVEMAVEFQAQVLEMSSWKMDPLMTSCNVK
jgi:hypothetical protein